MINYLYYIIISTYIYSGYFLNNCCSVNVFESASIRMWERENRGSFKLETAVANECKN